MALFKRFKIRYSTLKQQFISGVQIFYNNNIKGESANNNY